MTAPTDTQLTISAPQTTVGEDLVLFSLRWGPRVVIVALAGYYSLGLAYYFGAMAAIDRLAMDILLPYVGYAGIGAAMPTFQWYAAWAVRITVGLAAGLVYDLSERVIMAIYQSLISVT